MSDRRDKLIKALLDLRGREFKNPTDEWCRAAARATRGALDREFGITAQDLPLAIEIYNFEQREAAERDNAAARVRFDLDEPFDAGWRWREFA